MPARKPLEIEVKLKLRDVPAVRNKLEALGLELQVDRAFEDNWVLDFPDRSLMQEESLVRLREYNGKAWLTFKSKSKRSSRFKIRTELETEIGDASVCLQVFMALGLELTFRYQKFRTIFQDRSAKRKLVVTVDETPIGSFLEIEGSPHDIERMGGLLGYTKQDFIKESYLRLFANEAGSQGAPFQMVFKVDREENP